MPQIEREILLDRGIGNLWKLLNDPLKLGKCIPGCEKVTPIDETTSKWNVKMSAGVISRRIDATVRVKARTEPNLLSLKMDTAAGDMNGEFTIKLAEKSENSTLLQFSAAINAQGPFQWIVNQVIKNQLDKFVTQFTDCVKATI